MDTVENIEEHTALKSKEGEELVSNCRPELFPLMRLGTITSHSKMETAQITLSARWASPNITNPLVDLRERCPLQDKVHTFD